MVGLRVLCMFLLVRPGAAFSSDWIAQLGSPDRDARHQAIHALADEGSQAGLEALARYLATESDPELRRAAADAMERMLLDEPAYIGLLERAEAPVVRAFAAHRLGSSRSNQARAALVLRLSDPDPDVRREVYEALGRSGDRTLIPDLVRAAVREESPALREVAERAAATLAASRVAPDDVPTAIAILEGGTGGDRLRAAATLGRSGDWRALTPLVRALQDGDADLRKEAVHALGQLGDHRAVAPLVEIAVRSRGEVRYLAIDALGRISDEVTRDPLAGLLSDPDAQTRRLAIRALADLPGGGASLTAALRDADEGVRGEAIHALGRLGDPSSLQVLKGALEDPSPFNRAEAARLLADAGKPEVGPWLVKALEDRDALVRLSAADGLTRLAVPEAAPALRRLIDGTRDEEERALYQEMLSHLVSR